MKVLLVHPNDYLNIGIPNGLATLSAILKNAGHEVDIFDWTFIKTPQYYNLNKEKKSDKQTSIYTPTQYDIEDLIKNDPIISLEDAFRIKLNSFTPDLVAISVMTGYFERTIDLLKNVKVLCPIILGGVHPTLVPQDVLQKEQVNYICIGEGDELILELCDIIQYGGNINAVKNLGYKAKGSVFINDLRPFINLNNVPIPDWSLFDKRHLFRPFMGKIYKGSFFVMSRGCPLQCSYCVNGALKNIMKNCGKYFRYHSPQKTGYSLAKLKKDFGATWFKFADDSITLFSEEYLKTLSKEIKPINIKFGCSIRPETLTERKVDLLKEMGCVAASVGVESGNETIRKKILNRKMTNQQIIKSVQMLQDADIRVSTFNMIGLPGETRENVFETILLNKKLNIPAANVYILYPYPGTNIQKKYNINYKDKNDNIIPVEKAFKLSLSNMTNHELIGLQKTFNLYTRLPKSMWPKIRQAEGNTIESEKILKSLIKMLNT